jgi:hypothetical protein
VPHHATLRGRRDHRRRAASVQHTSAHSGVLFSAMVVVSDDGIPKPRRKESAEYASALGLDRARSTGWRSEGPGNWPRFDKRKGAFHGVN